ncbi:MAG: septum formation initiator family protein [bacterium]|nr:septum formation initiator family protein [bacterium]
MIKPLRVSIKNINFKRVIALGAIASVSIYIFAIGIKNVFRYNEFKQELLALRHQHAEAESESEFYTQQLNAMETEVFWEHEARRRLSYIKANEKVYKIIYKVQNR